jgi:alkyl sulfatase BDS1-like metallo-beta-lactamase superfamily hydrolase
MADLLELSSRIIDSGLADVPVNRVTQELSEIADGLAVIESFSHVVALRSEDGLVLFDTSGVAAGARCVEALRKWSSAPIHSLVYTHGHLDHVGGSAAFVADERARGRRAPRVIAHENVPARLRRYEKTDGYNLRINARQFGGLRGLGIGIGAAGRTFLPAELAEPDVLLRDRMRMQIGEHMLDLRHARGETDDHLWIWLPERRILCAGDFFIWNFPNAGNPQKVQRYPDEWAAALREMASLDAELFVPAHGLPIAGVERIHRVLSEVAEALESLVRETLERMNAGQPLDEIVHAVRIAPEVLARPYLRPLYDEPEFVVRNIWRLFGGWYDGNPAHLKPAPASQLASELARLAGGADALGARAKELAAEGDLRLACELIELAVRAAPESRALHGTRAEIYEARRHRETSLMAKGIYADAARDSQSRAEE